MSFIPTRDADLITWGANFAGLLTTSPTTYGLLATDALVIQTNYDEFVVAYDVSQNPSTRTIVTVAAKDEERAGFLSLARAYSAIIRANMGVSDEDKLALGLNVADTTPTPIPTPTTTPIIVLPLTGVNQVVLNITDSLTPNTKAKPFGVAGAVLFRADAATQPMNFTDANFLRILTRADNFVDTSMITDGFWTTYWAQWFNSKGAVGPMSPPASIIAL